MWYISVSGSSTLLTVFDPISRVTIAEHTFADTLMTCAIQIGNFVWSGTVSGHIMILDSQGTQKKTVALPDCTRIENINAAGEQVWVAQETCVRCLDLQGSTLLVCKDTSLRTTNNFVLPFENVVITGHGDGEVRCWNRTSGMLVAKLAALEPKPEEKTDQTKLASGFSQLAIWHIKDSGHLFIWREKGSAV